MRELHQDYDRVTVALQLLRRQRSDSKNGKVSYALGLRQCYGWITLGSLHDCNDEITVKIKTHDLRSRR